MQHTTKFYGGSEAPATTHVERVSALFRSYQGIAKDRVRDLKSTISGSLMHICKST